jgi:hypothetical protein
VKWAYICGRYWDRISDLLSVNRVAGRSIKVTPAGLYKGLTVR